MTQIYIEITEVYLSFLMLVVGVIVHNLQMIPVDALRDCFL